MRGNPVVSLPMVKRYDKENRRKRPDTPQPADLPYTSCKHLLTPGERRFYSTGLKPAIRNRYLISFKVRLADVITTSDWQSKYGRKIAQKHLDFILLTPRTTRIVAAIELNDGSHEESNRQQRDDFLSQALRSAGIPLVAFPIYQTYDAEKIGRRILVAISAARHK